MNAPAPETHEFQAEVKQLLDLMIHSLYSNKDIFLRELISNASDALDKLRFAQITDESLRTDRELAIRVDTDPTVRTISISDFGIGMTREEVVKNIGTIAKSGTAELRQKLAEAKSSGVPELIGQFGVGFYSSFMVADKVELVTRKAGEKTAVKWSSSGDGKYTITDAERGDHGTTVTLYLKPVDDDNGLHDYTKSDVIKEIVRRYSDFVGYPIKTQVWKKQGESPVGDFDASEDKAAPVFEDTVLNSMKAIWARPKGEVTDEEFKEFYRHVSHDWMPPLRHVSVKMEGTFEASALLYIPSKAPWDLYQPEMKRGVQLYVKRVFIMDECKELMPTWLRFVKGVVDAQDLSLNVSREILQKNRQIQAIRKQLVKRVLDTLDEMKTSAKEDHLKFWAEFGPVMKEGLLSPEVTEKDRILGLMLVSSTHSTAEATTLADYVSRMKPEQDAIYYLTGPNVDAVRGSPHLEVFKSKGYEVLLFADGIDEIWLERDGEFSGKQFKSVGKGDVDLGTDDEKKKAKEDAEAKEIELKGLLTALRVALQDEVKEVRPSHRLTESAVCLVGDEGDMSPQLVKLMAQMGQAVPKTKRILEVNPAHPVIERLHAVHESDAKSPLIADYARLLYGQAVLAEGGQLGDPAGFAKALAAVMVLAAKA